MWHFSTPTASKWEIRWSHGSSPGPGAWNWAKLFLIVSLPLNK